VGISAVVGVLVTVLVGALVLADLEPGTAPGRLVAGHVSIALGAAVVVCVAAFGGSAGVAWAGLIVLLAAGGVGLRLYTTTSTGVSPGVLVAHGAVAGLTCVLVLLAALKV
jgi:hypothetical protein